MTVLSRCLLVLGVMLAAACNNPRPTPHPPNGRWRQRSAVAEEPLLGIAYHDVEDRDPDQAVVAVRTERLIEQLAWLRENGYQAVSVDQILAARRGGPALPPKAVMLSFDDGYSSFYTRVMPILRAYHWPALLAPVGSWIDTPLNQPVDFAGTPRPRGEFLTWQQIREVSQSGLVEIAAHTDANHKGILANPRATWNRPPPREALTPRPTATKAKRSSRHVCGLTSPRFPTKSAPSPARRRVYGCGRTGPPMAPRWRWSASTAMKWR